MGETGQTLSVLETAFEMIEHLDSDQSRGVTALADELGLPPSTTHVYLNTLRELGYVVNEGGQYRVSLKFLQKGGDLRRQYGLFRDAHRYVDELSADVDDFFNVYLGVEEAGRRVILANRIGPKSEWSHASLGEYAPMHCCAIGKAILAHSSETEIGQILDAHGLASVTEQTITTEEELFDELEAVRTQGYAVEDEERTAGLRAIAAPIVVDERVIGGMAISGPEMKLVDQRIGSFVDILKSHVNMIELQHGDNHAADARESAARSE